MGELTNDERVPVKTDGSGRAVISITRTVEEAKAKAKKGLLTVPVGLAGALFFLSEPLVTVGMIGLCCVGAVKLYREWKRPDDYLRRDQDEIAKLILSHPHALRGDDTPQRRAELEDLRDALHPLRPAERLLGRHGARIFRMMMLAGTLGFFAMVVIALVEGQFEAAGVGALGVLITGGWYVVLGRMGSGRREAASLLDAELRRLAAGHATDR